jgi:ribosome-associated protein
LGQYSAPGLGRRNFKEDYVLFHTINAGDDMAAPKAAMTALSHTFSSEQLLERTLSSLDEEKAEDVIAINLRGKSEMADSMVVCSGRSSRQVTSIAEKLASTLKQDFGILCKIEGKAQGDWVLIDAGDVVVHVPPGSARILPTRKNVDGSPC